MILRLGINTYLQWIVSYSDAGRHIFLESIFRVKICSIP